MNDIDAVNLADDNADRFHRQFDANVRELLEPVREALIEGAMTCTHEEIIAQLMMNSLARGADEDYDTIFSGRFNADQKATLVRIADHMGPDWAQALYHAAVFMTRVA